MSQVLHPARPPVHTEAAPLTVPATNSRLARELRLAAEDLAGRVDRDELSLEEEMGLGDALDAAVDVVVTQVMAALDAALTPRLEALPLRARLTLTRARRRRELGLE